MSAASKAAVESVVSASLETSELAQGFIVPLNDLLKCGVSKLVLRFNSDNTVTINGINDNRNCISNVKYNEDFLAAVDIKKEYALGVYELSEFISLAGIFSSGFDMNISENHVVKIDTDGMCYQLIGSEVDAIKEGPKALTAQLDWFAEFKWEASEFANFIKAMGRLGQDYVRFEGKAGEKTLKMTVCDKDIKTSTFTYVIDLEDDIESDFKVVLNKNVLQPVVSNSIKDLKVQLSNKLVYFSGNSDYHEVKYYITAVEN